MVLAGLSELEVEGVLPCLAPGPGLTQGTKDMGGSSAGGGVRFLLKDLEEGDGETRLGVWTG